MSQRLDMIRSVLICPECRGSLHPDDDSHIACERCQHAYSIEGGVANLRRGSGPQHELEYLKSWRGRLRRHPLIYRWAFWLLAPVWVSGPSIARRWGAQADAGEVIIDIGAGNDRRHPRFVNVDLLPYPEVDVIVDAQALPFRDGSVTGVVNVAVLEHVYEPKSLLREVRRVLRDGGRLFLVVPFLQPFHAAPDDFRRWTLRGLETELERGYRIRDHGIYGGPASALAWILAEWVGLILSFGIASVRQALSPVLQVLCSPLKWLDLILVHFPGAEGLASSVYIEAEKVEGEGESS